MTPQVERKSLGARIVRLDPPILAVLAAALVLRVSFAVWLGERVYQPDEGVYVSLAHNVAVYGVLGTGDLPTPDRPPALPFLLGVLFRVLGPGLVGVRLVYALVSVASVWVLHRYATKVFGKRVGGWAAAAAAIYPFFVYWSGILMTETLTIFFVSLAITWTHAALESKDGDGDAVAAVAAGLFWGAATLTRTQNLAFPFLLTPWLAWRAGARRTRIPALFLAAALLLPALWAARNWKEFSAPTLDTHSGYTLAIRTMFYDQDQIDTSVADEALRKTELFREASALPLVQRDRVYMRASLRFIRQNPFTYLRHCAGNVWQFWRFYPRLDKTVGVAGTAFLNGDRRLFALVSVLTEPALMLLALFGLHFGLKEKLPLALPCLFIAGTTLIHALVISQMRYRIPVMPFVVLMASIGFVRLLDRTAR